jgi:hypothetical protein
MHNQNSTTDSKSQKWPSWLVLFLRWILGGLAGIGISSWFYFGLKNDIFTGAFLWVLETLSILFIPFGGHLHLFYPGASSFSHVNDFFVTFPVLFWGLIGALLASGRKSQITTGIILLVLFMIVGYISFFLVALRIPT